MRPETWIQRLVASGGILAALPGVFLIVLQPLPRWLSGLLSLLWLSAAVIATRCGAVNARLVRELHCQPDRHWRVLFDNGIWRSVERLPGCRTAAGLLWLRCGDPAGGRYCLLLRQRACRAEDWRRLQVLLRLPPA